MESHAKLSPIERIAQALLIVVLTFLAIKLGLWLFVDGHFTGVSRQDCPNGGACWPFWSIRGRQLLLGFYPHTAYPQLLASLSLFIAAIGQWHLNIAYRFKACLFLSLLALSGALFWGYLGTPISHVHLSGFVLTIYLTITGTLLAFPISIVLAFGRQSTLPIYRVISTTFIELIRGVPMISVLFMASVVLPLFLPVEISFAKINRAVIGIALFQAAYLAEVIRGGINAIPKGQYEAAISLGMPKRLVQLSIILPQAMVQMIPGISGTLIGLFKDTSLVMIIGMLDLLGLVQTAVTDPNWLGLHVEAYAFAAVLYMLGCGLIASYALYLEKTLKFKFFTQN